MKKKDTVSGRSISTVKWNLILFAAVFFISLFSLFFTRHILIENAGKMGEEITYGYSLEEEHNLEYYKTLIAIGAQYIDELTAGGSSGEEIEAWVLDYFIKMVDIVGEDTIDPYAVIDGRIIAANPWSEDGYDAAGTEWYRSAVAAQGRIIFTDAYMDAVYDEPVITIAKECGNAGNVIAFDIYPANFRLDSDLQKLPEGSEYFVCDSKGTLLYGETNQEMSGDELNERFRILYRNVKSGVSSGQSGFYMTAEGTRMEVYYRQTSIGWQVVLAIPQSFLLDNWGTIMLIYILIFVGYLSLIVLMWFRERGKDREIRKMNETVHILGDSYYAFYRVNVRRGTYEMTKGSEYVRNHLKPAGDYEELLGVFRDIIIEEDYKEFVESFSLQNIHRQLKNCVKEFGGDFRRLFDGEYKWVNVRMLFAPDLNQEEMVLCFRHVEEERKSRLKRVEAMEEALKAANASELTQKQFFSNISHDMRTPLNVIIGMSGLAEKSVGDTEKVREYIKKINYSSRQLLGLINDILEMSRLEQGVVLNSSRFNLRQSVESCVSVFRMQAQKEGKRFELNCSLTHENVYGDFMRLEQILNNLLSNAVKFTKKGDLIRVGVQEIESPEYVRYRIIVEDTGIGMTQEFLKKLFEPYQREKRFGAQTVEGTGLGMSIVKSIVSVMSGEITAESRVNAGTVFTVVLPFMPAGEETAYNNEPEETSMKTAEQPGYGTESGMEEKPDEKGFCLRGRTILLAEDYELNMELATEILEMNGASVVQAWNGKEALEAFEASQEFSIDAVLMDMQMPVMDGCESALKIRSLPRKDAGSVPIIAVTANAFSEDIARTMKAGMNAHVSKPIDVKVLCETITGLMNKNA